jgi:hypothetical protein
MTTARTEPVELKAVGLDGKTVPRRDLFLKPLDVAILKFHDLPTTCTDEMVMVALVRNIIVLGLGAKVTRLGQACFAKKVECAVNGRESKMGVFACQLMVHLFCRDMFLLEKCIKD